MTKRRIYDSEGHAQFVTSGCFHRRRLLDHPVMRNVLVDCFVEKIAAYQALCCGYVVMPDHLHFIIWFNEDGDLSRFMKSFKQTSSLRLKKLMRGLMPKYSATIPQTNPFWQPKYYPFNLFSERKAREKLDYMHMNPVRAGFVERAIDWEWSSARYFELGELSRVPLEWIFA
jgi:putative transposase